MPEKKTTKKYKKIKKLIDLAREDLRDKELFYDIGAQLARIKAETGWRVGQIIANAVNRVTKDNFDPFYLEDQKLLEVLKKM